MRRESHSAYILPAMRPRLLPVLFLLIGLVFTGGALRAQVFVWIGDSVINGNVSDSGNWEFLNTPPNDGSANVEFGDISAYQNNQYNVLIGPGTFAFNNATLLSTRPVSPLYTFGGTGASPALELRGNLLVEAGSTVSFLNTLSIILPGNIGNPSDPTNFHTVTVAGPGTLVTVAGGISGSGGNLIKAGTGTLTLTGASTYTHSTDVKEGTLRVDGGSITHATGDVTIGDISGDNGTMEIINGADVSGYAGVLGQSAGSTGKVLVSGAGSTWSNGYTVDVGYSGTGVLTIADGGIVSVTGGTNSVALATSGGNGTLNIGGEALEAAAAGGIINANSISSGSGAATLQFNTTATAGSPYYLTKDGTAGGTAVAVTGDTKIVVTAGYTVLKGTGNNYTDTTTINGGTLANANAGAFSASSPVDIGAAGNLQVNFNETIGGLDGSGTATLASGATLTVNNTDDHFFGGTITGAGTLNVTGIGELTLTGANTYTGGTFVDDTVLILDEGSISHSGNDLVVGHTLSGSSLMYVANDSSATNRIGYIGYAAISTGLVEVNGGSLWTNTDYLYVGVQGDGELDILTGGVVTSPNTSIGNNIGGYGAIYVGGAGSKLDTANTIYVGAEGNGYLDIYNGGQVESTDVSIGNNALGVGGLAELSGLGSLWTNTDDFLIGNAQDGYLYVSDQGAATTNTATIGVLSGVEGALAVFDAGSFTSAGHLVVGGAGTGQLSFSEGGVVATGGNAIVANSPGSTGNVYLGGAGSAWAVGGSLVVGNAGDGFIRITDSAVLSVGAGTGTITLGSGTGSIGDFHIGYDGEGYSSGGIINAASITTGMGTGTVLIGTNSTKITPFYLTRNGTGAGTYVTIDGATQVQQVFGYNVLGGNSTYTGTTTISGGTLVAASDNALGTSSVTINGGTLSLGSGVNFGNMISFGLAGGKLAGEGTFTSPLTLGSGVKLAPGSSPGTMNFASSLTLNNGGSLEIEIRAPSGTPGTDWDFVSIAGTFNLGSLTAGGYSLKVISLDLANNPGAVSGLTGPTSWVIATAGGGITGFEATDFAIDASEFLADGDFTLSQSANDLILSFTPVPEPSTYALMISGLVLAGLQWRRRRALGRDR